MLEIFLWIVVAIAGFMTIFGLSMRWAVRSVTNYAENRQRATQCIVEEGRVPDDWVRPFLQRIEAAQRKGCSPAELEGVGRKAQARFLHQLDNLMRGYIHGGSFDSEQTRRILLESLRERRQEWARAQWRALLGLDADRQE